MDAEQRLCHERYVLSKIHKFLGFFIGQKVFKMEMCDWAVYKQFRTNLAESKWEHFNEFENKLNEF